MVSSKGCLNPDLLLNEPEGNANLAVLTRKRCIEVERKIIISTLDVSAIDYESLPPNGRAGLIGALHIPVSLLGPIELLENHYFIPLALLKPIEPGKTMNCISRVNTVLKKNVFLLGEGKPSIGDSTILFNDQKYSPCQNQSRFYNLYLMMNIALGLNLDLPTIKNTPQGCVLKYIDPGMPWYFNPTRWDIHRIVCGEPESGCLRKKWPYMLVALSFLSTCKLFH